jgi:hypothetical protein
VPIFPSVEWFDAVRGAFNSDDANRTAGGGMADADVGMIFDDQIFLLKFAGYDCESVNEIQWSELDDADFYLEMHPDDWVEMVENIQQNGTADMDHTLNTLDMDSEDGLAKSATGDQYRLDKFFRFNQTMQFFFDASSEVETEVEHQVSATETAN